MKKKYAGIFLVLALWLGVSAFAWLKPAGAISDSERRPLKQFPAVTAKKLLSGDFSRDFGSYAVDQFPLRDGWRSLNALFQYKVLGKKDNNGIYLHDGFAAKMEYPLQESMVDFAGDRFNDLYEMYLKDSGGEIRFALVPDKGYYLADKAGALKMDYAALFDRMRRNLPWAEFVDLTDVLSIDSYYRTDTHWSQDKILPAAEKIAESLGVTLADNFTENTLDRDFYGVYYGQASLPMKPDALRYLTWEGWEDCTVTSFDTGKTTKIYDMDKKTSRDLYDVFLSGGMAMETIENPHGPEGKELIVFRDSFGSSLVPLLVQNYSRITVLDTRYIFPRALGELVDFEGKDVLFCYSSLILNSSTTLKK